MSTQNNRTSRRDALRMLGGGAACAAVPCFGAVERPWGNGIVVLIPGIMGSVLKDGNRTVWGPSLDVLLSTLKNRSLDFSELRTNTVQAPLRATGLTETVVLIPGFWSIDGYTEARQTLIRDLGLEAGSNYFDFPYDWRCDNRLAAVSLMTNVREWLGQWREKNKRTDGKAVIVAHSMGGLVARHACEVLGGWNDVSQVFSLGTPYQGSYRAVDRIVNGMVTSGLTDTLKTFDSVYQLMPTYKCFETGGRPPQSITTLSGPLGRFFDVKRAVEVGREFHAECNRHAGERLRKGGAIQGELVVLQGNSHKTICAGGFEGSKLRPATAMGGSEWHGDGTVPGFGLAEPVITSAKMAHFYCNQLHGSIQNYDAALHHITSTLRNSSFNASLYRGQLPISMVASDYVRFGEPIKIELQLPVRPQHIVVQAEDVRTGETVWKDGWEGQGGGLDFQFLFAPKSVGIYRISASGRTGSVQSFACSDISAVGA